MVRRSDMHYAPLSLRNCFDSRNAYRSSVSVCSCSPFMNKLATNPIPAIAISTCQNVCIDAANASTTSCFTLPSNVGIACTSEKTIEVPGGSCDVMESGSFFCS